MRLLFEKRSRIGCVHQTGSCGTRCMAQLYIRRAKKVFPYGISSLTCRVFPSYFSLSDTKLC